MIVLRCGRRVNRRYVRSLMHNRCSVPFSLHANISLTSLLHSSPRPSSHVTNLANICLLLSTQSPVPAFNLLRPTSWLSAMPWLASAPTLHAPRAHLNPASVLKWAYCASPLRSAIPVGVRAHSVLVPYSDAALIGVMLEGNDGAALKEGAKAVVGAFKDATGSKVGKEELAVLCSINATVAELPTAPSPYM